jgi:hypothetical protein
VSAGQVTRRARPTPSRKGLWFGLAAAALVGGGITAAAVVAGGGGSGSGSAADKGAPDKGVPDKGLPGKGSAVAGAEPAKDDPWGGAAGVPEAAPRPDVADTPDTPDIDDDDADDVAPSAGKHPPSAAKRAGKHAAGGDPTADALDQLDEAIRALPPDQQKRLAAYKGLSKLPPRERLKKLRELAAQGFAAAEVAEAGDPGGTDEPATPRPPPQSPTTGAWITNHSIDPPSGYDPEHLDVTAFIPWAIAQARHAIPDAQLIRIDTNGVGADGRANLSLASLASDHGSIDIRFISPSRGKRDPSQPLGVARHDFKCMFRVEATPAGVEMMPIDFFDCAKEHAVPVPRCSFSAVWKKAIQRKAPSHNAVGNVDYRSNGSRPVWYFDIGSGFDVAFSEMFADDC